MPKQQTPARAYVERTITGPSGRPSVVIRRRAKGKGRGRPQKAPERAPERPPGVKARLGRPRVLEDPIKVLVTLEACDVDALHRWQRMRSYTCRSAAIRAMIAEVCGHE